MAKFDVLFLVLSMAVIMPALLNANVLETTPFWKEHAKEFDSYWQERAKVAEKTNGKAYSSDPFAVTGNVSSSVNKLYLESREVRRNLRGMKKKGPCVATNPIDQCWRCDPNWANNRQKLADCALGFGRETTGGKGGPYYVVTDSSDNDLVNPKPGTLRHAVTRYGPLWIIFERSMVIRLNEELIVSSDKTIDGRGANVHIANGAGITIQFVNNVIVHGLKIYGIRPGNGGIIRDSEAHYGFRTRSDGDGISIFGSSNVWIDHVSMKKCADGLIDAIMGSTAITISNSHFTDHNEVMLFGATNDFYSDQIMQITVAFNHFGKRLIQRMPRCRFGFVHVVNNDYTHWEMYAIGGSQAPTILSEGNRFIATHVHDNINATQVTKREYAKEEEWSKWQWKSIGDVFMGGAYFVQSGPELTDRPAELKDDLTAKPGTLVGMLTRYAGHLACVVGKPC